MGLFLKKILLIIYLLSCSAYAIAQIHGTAMGGISTVTSEGAIDSSRNPALLGTHSSASASFYLMGNIYYNEDVSPELHASGIDIQSIKKENDVYYFFSLFAGYAEPAGKGTIGYSLSSRDNFYSHKKDTQKLTINMPPVIEQTETTVTDELYPSFNIGYGWKLTDNNYSGIQLSVTPFFSNKKTNNKNSLVPGYSYTKQEYGIVVKPSLGFLLTSTDSQVGLRFIPSTLKCVKKKAEADFSTTNLSYSDSWDVQQYEGPQISAGGYAKILSKTGLAIEFGIFLPTSYTNTEINVTDNPVPAIKHSLLTIYNDPIINLKGGVHYSITDKLECMAGTAFFHFKNSADSSKTYGRGTFNLLLFTFGSNYSLSSKTILSTLVLITKGSFESFYHAEDIFSLEAKTKSTSWSCTVGAGLSYNL